MASHVHGCISLSLLSDFELRHDGELVHVPLPAQRLLALLAFHERPVSRRTAATTLWPASGEPHALARLRSTLWRMPVPGGHQLLELIGSRLRLSRSVTVDLHLAQDEDRVDELDVRRLCDDVLSDWDEDWVLIEQERFRQVRLHCLERLAEVARRDGRYPLALEAALAAVAIDPLRESGHRQVMLVHLAEDNPSEALRQYGLLRRVLSEELGLPPAHATRAIVADLLGRPVDTVKVAS